MPEPNLEDVGEAFGGGKEDSKLEGERGVRVRKTRRGSSAAGVFDSASRENSRGKGGSK
jgi:hypothetical protein